MPQTRETGALLPNASGSARIVGAKEVDEARTLVSERGDDVGQPFFPGFGQADGDPAAANPVELPAHETRVLAPQHELGDRALPQLEPVFELAEARPTRLHAPGLQHQQQLVAA